MKSLPQLPSVVPCISEEMFRSDIPGSCFPFSCAQTLSMHHPSWVRVQLCLSATHRLPVFLQWFVRLRGTTRCCLFTHPQRLLSSALLTYSSYPLLSYFLPSSSFLCLSFSVQEVMNHTDMRCVRLHSYPAFLRVSFNTVLYLACSLHMPLVLPSSSLFGKTGPTAPCHFIPFVELVLLPSLWNSYGRLCGLWSIVRNT